MGSMYAQSRSPALACSRAHAIAWLSVCACMLHMSAACMPPASSSGQDIAQACLGIERRTGLGGEERRGLRERPRVGEGERE